MEPSAALSSSWCPKGLIEHLACWCFTGKQKILQDSIFAACLGMCFHDSFCVWAADKHIQASVWKNNWFSPGISSKAVYWNSVPRGCFIFPLPLEQHRILSSHRKDLGSLESVSYNQCGQGRNCGAFIIFCGHQPVVLLLGFSQQSKKLRGKGRNFLTCNAHVSAKSQDKLISHFSTLVHSPAPDALSDAFIKADFLSSSYCLYLSSPE